MNLATHTLSFTTAALIATVAGTAHAAVYTNANGTGLWSDSLNWTGGDIADNNTETAQLNPTSVDVDSDFTVNNVQNSFGTSTQTITGAGTLTIDRNAASGGPAISNVAGNAGGTMTVDTNVDINNTGGGISWIRNLNSASNVLAMGTNSVLNLGTAVEVVQAIGGSVQFNGTLTGNAALRITHNDVSFGATSDSPAYGGELVLFTNASVVADTAAGNVFFGGSKVQFNGNSSLTLNNENVIANTPLIGTSGTPTIDLNVNADQAFGNLALGSAYMNINLDSSVNNLTFLPSAAFDWTGATLNINNFKPAAIGFGFDGGLSAQQLSQITIDGAAPTFPLSLTTTGRLVPEPASLAMVAGGLGLVARRRRD